MNDFVESQISDALVIGAGQAGLAAARALQREGVQSRIVEAEDRLGGAWPHYYESLKLFSPSKYSSMRDMPFPGSRNHYPLRNEVVAYLEAYAARFNISPVLNSPIERIARRDNGFVALTVDGRNFSSKTIVVASGTFKSPYTPQIPGAENFRGQILHASSYVKPEPFQGKNVIVVGAANSAVQIAVELAAHAEVTLATREKIRFVRQKLLGLDVHFWFRVLGVDATNWLSDQGTPVLDDGRYFNAVHSGRPKRKAMFSEFTVNGVRWADGETQAADVVIFATGYRPHAPFLQDHSVWKRDGRLNQRNGAALHAPGIFFVGQPGLRTFASGTLRGVSRDASIVARKVRHYLRRS